MHLHCFHFTLTAVPSLPFHSAKRLMCFPKAALRWDIFQTFYTELSDGGSHPDPLSGPYAATYVSRASFDNADTPFRFGAVNLSASPLFSVKLSVTSVLINLEQNHSRYCIKYTRKDIFSWKTQLLQTPAHLICEAQI